MYRKITNKSHIIAVFFLSTAMLFFTRCTNKDNGTVIDIDRSTWPSIRSENKLILVSDSGMLKLRVFAPVHEMYDDKDEPYWEFPEGIVMERFGPGMVKEADIKSNYAHYSVNEELWRWENKVVATNSQNEVFETELLYWNQKKEHIYTDEFIRITLEKGYQTGYGFESNQDFTKYAIKQSQAEFPLNMN